MAETPDLTETLRRIENLEQHRIEDRKFHTEIRADLKTSLDNQGEMQTQLTELNGTLRDVVVELGGAPAALGRDPSRKSIRIRVHDLEEMQHAASAVGVALGLLFGRVVRWAMLAGILIAAVGTMLRLFGVGG